MPPPENLLTPDSLPMPSDRENNFWYVRPSSATDVTVVFLHGIFSTSRSCWLYSGSENSEQGKRVFWPDLFRTDQRLGSPAIYLAGYYTKPDAGDYPIAQCAKEVMDALQRPELDGTQAVLDADAVVFVCHSMGGIMARYLIERHQAVFRRKAVGLALLASPSLGSEWANVAGFAARYYNQHLAQQLEWKGDSLSELHGRFRDLVDSRATEMPGLFGMEAAETKMIYRDSLPGVLQRWILPNRLQIVEPLSAGQYFGEVTSLPDTDHFSIVKPYGFSHPAHDFLVTFMRRFREKLALLQQHGLVGRPATITTGAALAGGQTTQQIPIDLPHPESAAGEVSFSPKVDARALKEESNAAFALAAAPRPRLDELFEIITEPDDVQSALYRAQAAAGLSPCDAEYVNARTDVSDIQQTLETVLREGKGRLVVTGRQGIGKTREVAELARAHCARRGKVLVARDEGNVRLGPPVELPAGWSDARVLIVVDNLHGRLRATADEAAAPYLDRLERLLQWFESRLPGDVRIVATARDEARFQPQLAMAREAAPGWGGFAVHRLPVLTDDGLQRILTAFAASAKVAVDADVVPRLVENSDRMPETMFMNVVLARRARRGLDKDKWSPVVEGETWKQQFVSVQAKHPGVEGVCRALRLLTQIGLPARVPYVIALAGAGAKDPMAAVNALVDEGLLGMRQDVLQPLSTDQLDDYLGKQDAPAAVLSNSDTIEHSILNAANAPKERADDLLALVTAVARAGDLDRAQALASRAVDGDASARAYRIRASIRFDRREFELAEADLTSAIGSGGDDADTRFLRGVLRNLVGKFSDAIDDLSAAVRLGRDDSVVHAQLATAYYQKAQWLDVDREFTLAIERDATSGQLYFVRGIARLQLKNAAGAEDDLTAALDRSVNFDLVATQIRAIQTVGAPVPDSAAASAPVGAGSGGAMIRLQRAIARLGLSKFAEAEEDLTAAIDHGATAELSKLAADVQASSIPLLAAAKQQLAPIQGPTGQGGPYHLRGVARLNQGKLEEAEADFDEAIARGYVEAEVYGSRAWTRFRRNNPAGAAEDASVVIDDKGRNDDAFMYSIRALSCAAQERFAEAEADCTKAIDLAGGNAAIFAARANARVRQQRLPEAEDDLTKALSFGGDAQVLFNRGCVRVDLGNYVDAEADFTEALKLGFQPATLFSMRGLARLAQENIEKAEEDAVKAFELGADDLGAYSLRAKLRLERNDFAGAEADFNEAGKRGRADAWLFFHRGRSRGGQDHYAEAEEDYTKVVAMGVIDPGVSFNRGQARFAQENFQGAAADFVDAIRLGRDDGFAHAMLAETWARLSRYRDSEAEADLALARHDNAWNRRARGFARLARGAFDQSEQDYNKALALEPNDSDTLSRRGMARFGQGNAAGAIADYDTALKLAPDNVSIRGSRAVSYVWLGDLDAAVRDCEALDAIDRNDVETLGAWGAVHLARGEYDAAVDRLTAAAQTDKVWNRFLGLIYLVAGKLDEARAAYADGSAAGAPGTWPSRSTNWIGR